MWQFHFAHFTWLHQYLTKWQMFRELYVFDPFLFEIDINQMIMADMADTDADMKT